MNVGLFRNLKNLFKFRALYLPSLLPACSTDARGSRLATNVPDTKKFAVPDPPTNCCMSGCANCVWIEYAKQLEQILQDRTEATRHILDVVEDPSLKIFLSIELKDKASF